jgi:hypothetical protein
VVDGNHARGFFAPQKPVGANRGEGTVGAAVVQERDRAVDVARLDERRRALNEHGHVGIVGAGRAKRVERVQEHDLRGGVVRRELGRSDDQLGPRVAGQRGDGVVVGAHHNLAHRSGGTGRGDRPHHERDAADRAQVLSRDPFGPAPRRYEGVCRRT